MDVLEAIKSRRSIRKYKPIPVEDEKLNRVLEAARWAPSAGNRQPWEFVVVKDSRIRKDITEVAPYGKFIIEAPLTIVVVVDPNKDPTHYIEDGAIAATHILLSAHALGLGSCWVGAFGSAYENGVKRILGIPTSLRIVALVALGYPAETTPSMRKELKELVHHERMGRELKEQKNPRVKDSFPRLYSMSPFPNFLTRTELNRYDRPILLVRSMGNWVR